MSYSPMSFTTATAGRAGFVRLGTGIGGQSDGTIVINSSALFSSPTFTGLTTLQQSSEVLNSLSGATGTVTHNLSLGAVWYHSSISSNFTANFTNVPTTNDRTTSVVLILNQGLTGYLPTAVQIDGSAQTIKWFGTPVGTASQVDVVSFTLIRTGSAWTVLGAVSSYA